jgi:DNA excision repair protein ERCC-3
VIIQSDFSIFLETNDPDYEQKRNFLALISQLEKSPEHIHTYRITNFSLWTAAALKVDLKEILDSLKKLSKFSPPVNVIHYIEEYYKRYGRIKLENYEQEKLFLRVAKEDKAILKKDKKVNHLLLTEMEDGFIVDALSRGTLKILLIYMDPSFPVEDLASFKQGDPLTPPLLKKDGWEIRPYQKEAADIFMQTGHGVIVVPCGAGKTIIGLDIMKRESTHTLIVVPHHKSLLQWKNEIMSKLEVDPSQIGEYSGLRKEIRPITIATYQILSYQSEKEGFKHLKIFSNYNWGLMIYDEVHMLPAAIFKFISEIQSVKRLGLTATLIREDGKEKDVFSLIGPKRFDVPWKELEEQNYIAKGLCIDCHVSLSNEDLMTYYQATKKDRPRLSAENRVKDMVVKELVEKHQGSKIIVIGQYLDQLKRIAHFINAPLITGQMSHKNREKIYEAFKNDEIRVLVLSKIANLAIDLPDASVAIQVSGAFGSRQEEAQRLGRILRPKQETAFFYSVISRDTVDEEFSFKRQMFLVEQGYQYQKENWD